MQMTIDELIEKMNQSVQFKEDIMYGCINGIQEKYKDRICEKQQQIDKLNTEKEYIKRNIYPSISETKKIYSIERNIKMIESDLKKIQYDMDFEIDDLFTSNTSVYSLRTDVTTSIPRSIDNVDVSKLAIIAPNFNIKAISSQNIENINSNINIEQNIESSVSKPWDRRIYRAFVDSKSGENAIDVIPYNIEQSDVSTHGYFPSNESLNKYMGMDDEKYRKIVPVIIEERAKAQNDPLNQGVYAVSNPYAIMTLYGSNGGKYLMDKKKRRSWYEVDNVNNQSYGFAKNPTTTNIISWGNADPYNRTPYQFSDFVMNKYWNKIPNNRLITLRKYGAPVLDNLNFPGMDGISGEAINDSDNDNNSSNEAQNSSRVQFAPVATAISYFGDETSNKLSNILKFSAGVPWEDLTADVWKPDAPDPGYEGIETSFGLVHKLNKLNVFGGNWDFDAAMRKGGVVPDPYEEGPYENKIIGPVNAIKTVKKRKQGIDFKMDGMNIVFEYTARPIGGVNTKAVMLDIISNFLVMGTTNAIFFGGAHRFLSSPKGYPFLGGDAGMQAFYRGQPVKFAGKLVEQAWSSGVNIFEGVTDMMNKLWSAVKKLDVKGLLSSLGSGASGDTLSNVTREYMSSRATAAVPHLTGMRALLIGEPVGEWHLTIGNPMNPIALIGNLVCAGIDFECGDELGPDDFPLDIKITVKLQHGMPRDKDAIQSIFNRGYGRIYALPDNFATSSDYNTHVDKATEFKGVGYNTGNDTMSGVQIASGGQMLGAATKFSIEDNVMQSQPSVWNRLAFGIQTTPSQNFSAPSINNRTIYRSNRWIAESGLR